MRNHSMSIQRLRITSMTCDHCARTVEDALNALPGVKARVSYPQGIAEIQVPKDLGTEQLLQVVKAKGFGASPVEREKKPHVPTFKPRAGGDGAGLQVAIIGSGPAGLSLPPPGGEGRA